MAGRVVTFGFKTLDMKQLLAILMLSICFGVSNGQSKLEKINVSYWYVFGRFPSPQEQTYWNGQPDQSISWYINNHHTYLKADDASNTQAVTQSYKDAFGRQPSAGERDFWKKQQRTYADLMNEHVQYLLRDPAENRATIARAYQAVYNRAPSAGESGYLERSNLSYLMLTACLRSYKSTGYRLQSVEGITNFLKGAWETTTNFVVNTGSAIYNAAAGAVSSAVVAGQRILTLKTSIQTAGEVERFDRRVVGRTESGQVYLTGGASAMVKAGDLIGVDPGTLIAAGGLN
jgi:hypothetical protein